MNQTTCKDCGKPIYWPDDAQGWYHASLPAILACPAVDVEPAPAPMRLDGCTCAAIAGSHVASCVWAA